jgi:hypothetical protein
LRIYQPDGPMDVAITGRDLSWPIEQLSEFQIANIPKHPHLQCYYATAGLGIPLVVIRKPSYDCGSDLQERYFRPRLPVAATMSLRPRHQDSGECTSESCREFVLELANPLRVASIAVSGRRYPLARDISAPLEYHMANLSTNPLIGFLSPGSETRNEGLLWLEPYQPGKIPLIFVHGLLSDPTTWFDMLNHLRTQAWFNERYQVWGFSYDTGSPFVSSAARLRSQSREALAMIDPHGQDPAFGQMVLIGHSMGGLVAKLQISESGDQIWNSIAKVPLESIHTSEEIREQLAERLYFSPQPFVRRVVYIATPHCGSTFASLGIGRWSSLLIRPEDETQELHQQLVRDNPGVFIGQFRKRVPSSIDLLQPSNPTLQAIYNLRVPKCIMQHTIIGTGKWPLTLGCGDGVVPVESALHPCTVSKAFIASSHTGITKEDETTCEVARILRLHLDECVSPEFEQN